MSAVRTIDVKGLEHADKEKLIFPGLESLKDRETLRIVVEFNPTPLVYLLKAEGKLVPQHDGRPAGGTARTR